MKTNSLCCLVVAFVFVIGGAALAADYVDIGNPTSEAGHNLQSWGPPEPATNPGSWGGIAGLPNGGGTCRVIWSPSDGTITAEVELNFSGLAEIVSFMHLDGIADDTFDVYVDGTLIGTYADSGNPGENWYINGFTHTPASSGMKTVGFTARGIAWPSWGTYGQVAIAGVWISSGPVAVEESTWGDVKSLFR